MVLDLSTTSSLQSSSSIHSSRESDAGSDEGILLDDIDGASDSGENNFLKDYCPWSTFSCKGLELPSVWPRGQKFVPQPQWAAFVFQFYGVTKSQT